MRKPLPVIHPTDFPSLSHNSFLWLGLIRNYTYELKEYVVNVDLPNLSGNTTIIQSVTVPGVATGDKVLHIEQGTISADFMVLHGYVSAADTVQVQVHRGVAGGYNPAAEDWTFLVLKNNI